MPAPTGPERRKLRSRGQTLPALAAVGKAGLTDAFVERVGRLLAETDLLKVRLGELHGAERKAQAAELAERAGAELVGVVGRTALLYRAESPDDGPAGGPSGAAEG